MIEKVILKSVASYDGYGVEFNDLKKANFIYGNNGCGKSTFSSYFLDRSQEKYSECLREGKFTDTSFYVYNQGFVEDNFKGDDIPGIFTLGKESIGIEEKIVELDKQIEKNREKLDKQEQLLSESAINLRNKETELKDYVWNYKVNKESKWFTIYNSAFQGYNNNKSKFLDYYLQFANQKYEGNEEDLLSKAKKIFDNNYQIVDEIPNINEQFQLNTSIFEKIIIGDEAIQIAELINSLQISDWVHSGKLIIEKDSLEVCPLCQQNLDDYLTEQLNVYFNEEYNKNMKLLEDTIHAYHYNYQQLIDQVKQYQYNDFIDEQVLIKVISKLDTINIRHRELIQEKIDSPSTKVSVDLTDINEIIADIRALVEQANIDIRKNNEIANNIKSESLKVQQQVCNHFAYSISVITLKIIDDIEKTKKMIESIKINIQKIKNITETAIKGRQQLIKDAMGIEESSININAQLKSYGFENFKLNNTSERGKYSIIRPNGEAAHKTLSEGERTFITFLYYYQLVMGEVDRGPSKKILIIDDPISSLDSTVLYIVAALIKDLIEKINSSSKIEQIILLTHNTYFYKEVTYNVSKSKPKDFAKYYVLRKKNDVSEVKSYDINPITTSYEELWKELIEVKDSSSSTIQNVMRRILENYFRFLGGKGLDDLIEPFDDSQKPIVKSLIMWTHDGSHYIPEDLYVQQSDEMNGKYYRLFREIFVKNNHESHFEMMLKKCVPLEKQSIFMGVEVQIA